MMELMVKSMIRYVMPCCSQILASEQEDASLTTELWFGVEVSTTIITPYHTIPMRNTSTKAQLSSLLRYLSPILSLPSPLLPLKFPQLTEMSINIIYIGCCIHHLPTSRSHGFWDGQLLQGGLLQMSTTATVLSIPSQFNLQITPLPTIPIQSFLDGFHIRICGSRFL